MTAVEVTDLPEPDSPTRASTSPRATDRLTPRTALTRPSSEGKETFRSETSSSGAVLEGSGSASSPLRVSTAGTSAALFVASADVRVLLVGLMPCLLTWTRDRWHRADRHP